MILAAAPELSDSSKKSDSSIEIEALRLKVLQLEKRVQAGEQRRRALVHIMSDLADSNRKLSDQRKAMLHILADYERDRKDLGSQSERLNNSRRALMHILEDAHQSNLRLGQSRKAMIHIMGDLRQTTDEIRERETELREKQEQLVQAGKLATLGELTTGVAHELNNPLNNIGLYIGNVLDRLRVGRFDRERVEADLTRAMGQVDKATQIINHLRTFGRAAPAVREAVSVNEVVRSALSLLNEQFRLREIDVQLDLDDGDPVVLGSAIQLEQVVMNLLTNARDALQYSENRCVSIHTEIDGDLVRLSVCDSGPGVPVELQQRVFDPFFTTKDVGEGTGLGLSIVYGIVKEHDGTIVLDTRPELGSRFVVELPRNEKS